MNTDNEKNSGWETVFAAIDEVHLPTPETPEDDIWTDGDGVRQRHIDYKELRKTLNQRGPGFVYSYAFSVVDFEVCNCGFSQLHANGEQDELRDAITGYERLGQRRMVAILRSSAKLCEPEAEWARTESEWGGGDMTGICPDNYQLLADTSRDLDELYLTEKRTLPVTQRGEPGRFKNFVD